MEEVKQTVEYLNSYSGDIVGDTFLLMLRRGETSNYLLGIVNFDTNIFF